MQKKELKLVTDIANNKDTYLSMIKDENDKKELNILYEEFFSLFSNYRLNLSNEVISRAGYQSALKSHKIDPYIAGGIGQGIAGVGAGLYTASSAAANNKKIDESRSKMKKQVFSDSYKTKSSEKSLLRIAMKIDKILKKNSEILKYQDKGKEKIYNKAKDLMNKVIDYNSIRKAQEIFASLDNYKDSKKLQEECIQKSKIARQKLIALCSGAFGLLVLIPNMGEVPFFVGLIAFGMAFIMLQFYIK